MAPWAFLGTDPKRLPSISAGAGPCEARVYVEGVSDAAVSRSKPR